MRKVINTESKKITESNLIFGQKDQQCKSCRNKEDKRMNT